MSRASEGEARGAPVGGWAGYYLRPYLKDQIQIIPFMISKEKKQIYFTRIY